MKTAKEMLEISNNKKNQHKENAKIYAESKLDHYSNLIEEAAAKGSTWITFRLPDDYITCVSSSSDDIEEAIITLLTLYGYRVVGSSIQGITWALLDE